MQTKKHLKNHGVLNGLSLKAKEALDKVEELDEIIDYTKRICEHTNGKIFDFDFLKD